MQPAFSLFPFVLVVDLEMREVMIGTKWLPEILDIGRRTTFAARVGCRLFAESHAELAHDGLHHARFGVTIAHGETILECVLFIELYPSVLVLFALVVATLEAAGGSHNERRQGMEEDTR